MTTLITLCAWCPKGADAPRDARVSHGICADCKAKFVFDVMKRPQQRAPDRRGEDGERRDKTVDING